jgi:hypothetical protein
MNSENNINECLFSNNYCGNCNGLAVYINNGMINITNSSFVNNSLISGTVLTENCG